MNIAADFEINDDAYGDGLATPAGAIRPEALGLPPGNLMEDYLRWFQLGPRTQELAWLDCGSGADGLDRDWDLGADGADGLTEQQRDAVRFRVAQGITGRPGSAPRGWRRWAEEAFHPPQPWRQLLGAAIRSAVSAPGAGRTTSTAGPRVVRCRCPASCCRACAAGRPGCAWSSTPPDRSATPNWAARCSKSPRSHGRWAGAAISSPWCPATRRRESRTRCAAPRTSAAGRRRHGPAHRFRQGAAHPAPPRRGRRPHRRPDRLAGSRPPCRTVVGLFPRRYDTGEYAEDDPDYVPDTPPDWARVVEIGSAPIAR